MEGMIRQTYWLTIPQIEALKAEAAELGIKTPEMLRRVLDERRFGNKKKAKKDGLQ